MPIESVDIRVIGGGTWNDPVCEPGAPPYMFIFDITVFLGAVGIPIPNEYIDGALGNPICGGIIPWNPPPPEDTTDGGPALNEGPIKDIVGAKAGVPPPCCDIVCIEGSLGIVTSGLAELL